MTRCMLINLADADDWTTYVADGHSCVPKQRIPTVLHASRELADLEAVRLARELGAPIGVLELVDVVDVLPKPAHVTAGGSAAATEQIPTWAETPESYLP